MCGSKLGAWHLLKACSSVVWWRVGGNSLHDVVDTVVGLLKLYSCDVYDVNVYDVCGTSFECFGRCSNPSSHIEVDVVGECSKSLFFGLDQLLHVFP